MKRAILLAVGTELLRLGRQDTNTLWLAERLAPFGIETDARLMAVDDERLIGSALRSAITSADVVMITGGLGPTVDDRTREGLALACDRPLKLDAEQDRRLADRFTKLGRHYGENQRRQAHRPAGFSWMDNPLGSAAGLRGEVDGCELYLFPGVPSEMRSIFVSTVEPSLRERFGGDLPTELRTHRFKIAGRSEGELDASLEDLFDSESVETTVLCGSAGIEIHLRQRGEDGSAFDVVRDEMRRRLAPDLYSEGDSTLASRVGTLLAEQGRSLAVAESCTAGMLAAELGGVAGASSWFQGGVVCYANEVKCGLLGVAQNDLERTGAVSQPVAEQLARGVRQACGSDWGIGITGIAGPDGGTAEKPVGTVHVAVSAPTGECRHWATLQLGDREQIRRRSAFFALDQLRRWLIEFDR